MIFCHKNLTNTGYAGDITISWDYHFNVFR